MISKKEQEGNLISLRRSKVIELLAKGYVSQAEIARTLNISEPTVSRDIKFISEQNQKDLRDFVDGKIPMCSLECEVGFKTILKKLWSIVDDPNSKKSEVISASGLISNIYEKLMELSTFPPTLARAVSVTKRRKAEILELEQRLQERIEQTDNAATVARETEEENHIDKSQYKF